MPTSDHSPFLARPKPPVLGFIALLFLIPILAGCDAGHGLVGTWSATVTSGQTTTNYLLKLNSDGTYSREVDTQVSDNQTHITSSTIRGTYTFDANELSLTPKESVQNMEADTLEGQPAIQIPYKLNGNQLKLMPFGERIVYQRRFW